MLYAIIISRERVTEGWGKPRSRKPAFILLECACSTGKLLDNRLKRNVPLLDKYNLDSCAVMSKRSVKCLLAKGNDDAFERNFGIRNLTQEKRNLSKHLQKYRITI